MSESRFRIGLGRRPLSRRSVLGAAALGTASSSAFVLACGGGREQPGAPAAQQAPGAAPTAAVEAVKTGGVFQGALPADPPSTDPYKHASYLSQQVGGFVMSKLLKFDSGPKVDPTDYQAAGDVAASWEIPDPLTYSFKLRPDVRFHDIPPVSGRVLEASDVAYTFNRFLTTSVYKGNLTPVIERVDAPDATSVVVKLKKPSADFVTYLADGLSTAVWIFPKEADNYDTIKTVIGSGPWLLDSFQPGIAIAFKRNPNYFLKDEQGRPLPYMDGVRLNIIPEYAQKRSQLMAGNIHAAAPAVPANQLNASDIKDIRQAIPNHRVIEMPMPITLNMFVFRPIGPGSTSPFNDVRVRRAVSMAVDRDGLIRAVSNEDFYTAEKLPITKRWQNVVAAGMSRWWLDPKAALQKGEDWAAWYKYDPAEAKKLLSAAGYTGGFEAEYHRTIKAYGDSYDDSAEAIVPMLSAVGIRPKVLVHDYASKFFPDIYSKADYTGIGKILQSFTTPGGWLFNLYHPDGAFNRNKWNDPQLNEIITKQEAELDFERRRSLVYEAQRYISNVMHNVPLVLRGWSYWTVTWPLVRNWEVYRETPGSNDSGTESLMHVWLNK